MAGLDDLQAKYEIDQHPAVYQFQGFVRLPNGEKRGRTLAETVAQRRQAQWNAYCGSSI